jgi:hypothetical protein
MSGHAGCPAIGGVRRRGPLRVPRDQQRGGELSEAGQAGVQRDPRDPTNPQRQQPVLVLQPAELALHSGALPVVRLPLVGAVRDQRVQPVALIQTDAGTHSPDGQRHLDAPRLASAQANVHSPCSQVGGLCFPALTAGSP